MLTPTTPLTNTTNCPKRGLATSAALSLGLAVGLSIAVPSAALGAAPSFREQKYVVSHDFDVKPGGNLPPLVTTRAFCQAWATTSDPFCFDFDVLPFLANVADPNFDPAGETKLDCGNPTQNGNELTMQENVVGPGGTFDFYNANASCGATFGDANSLIIIDPYPGFGAWGPGSSVSGFISSFGTAHADAAGLAVGSTTEAYAFSASGFKIQGLQLNPDGTIDWLPAIEDTVAGDANASGQVVRDYDPICYKATNTSTGASASGTLMSSYVEMCDEEGVATWTEDKLYFNSQCGEFEIDLTDTHISPNGYIFFRVEDGEVVETEATGMYAGLNPALGATVPFSLPLTQAMSLAYDLTPVFDALLSGASPAGLQGADGDPDYSEIDLELEFGDAGEDYAAAANDGSGDDCVGDANGDGVIDSGDLNVVLGEFGQSGEDLAGDLNGDGVVNSGDLNIVLGEFGNACPPDEPVFGACCVNGICVQTSYQECVDADGVWGGIDVLCEDFDPCNPNPAGACCFGDGTCDIVLGPEDCAAQGEAAVFFGPGTSCEDVSCQAGPPTGACCLTDGTCIDGIDFQSCVLLPGSDVFHPNKACNQVNCGNKGACCLPGGVCDNVTPAECELFGGIFNGVGSNCDDVDCNPNPTLGACCFTDGTCIDGIDFQSCVLLPGSDTFHPGKTCSQINCGQDNVGACCFSDAGCQVMLPIDCLEMGGFFQGPGTNCADVNCEPNQDLGACCFPDGACLNGSNLEDCAAMGAGNIFFQGMSCEDAECGNNQPGACCLGFDCIEEIAQICDDLGGAFQGPGTSCADATCAPSSGACCLDGGCTELPILQCVQAGGEFIGGPCDPTVCQPSGGSDCCVPNGTPGCETGPCENLVCSQDPFCCDVQWDQICANLAQELCVVCGGGSN